MHRARQRGRGVRYDDLLRLVVVAGVPSSRAARTPFLISVVLVRTAADGPMRQNRWAGRRWHRAAPAGCAGARLEPFDPNLPAQWTRPRGRLSGLALPGGASPLTDHTVLHRARRRARRLKYDRQRGRGVETVADVSFGAALALEMTIASACCDGCKKCCACGRVCVCQETLCMGLMHVMDSNNSLYDVFSVNYAGSKVLQMALTGCPPLPKPERKGWRGYRVLSLRYPLSLGF